MSKKGEGRQHQKMDVKNVKEETATNQGEFQTTFDNKLTKGDTHIKARGDGAELLGFGAAYQDDEVSDRRDRGGRGGRGDRPMQTGPRGGRGGRRGGKFVVDDNDFPAL